MILTPSQVGALAYANTKPRLPHEFNTITLASLARRGAVEKRGKHITLTSLGKATYQFNLKRGYLEWKDSLKEAKKWKRS